MVVRHLLLAGTLMLAFAAIGWSAARMILAHLDLASISAAPQSINFGEIPEGATVNETVWISNRSRIPAEISKIVPSCGCTTASIGTNTSIRPGHRISLKIGFDSYGRPGSQEKFVTVYFKQPTYAIQVQLTGTVRRQVSIQPERLDLPIVQQGHPLRGAVLLTRLDGARLNIHGASAGPGIKVFNKALSSSISRITIVVPETDQTGDFSRTLNINCNLPDEETIKIPLTYTVRGSITAEPPDIDFGLVRPGQPRTGSVTLMGPLAGSALVASCPRGINARVIRVRQDKAVLQGQCLYRHRSNIVLHSHIWLKTKNGRQRDVFIPVYAATQ